MSFVVIPNLKIYSSWRLYESVSSLSLYLIERKPEDRFQFLLNQILEQSK